MCFRISRDVSPVIRKRKEILVIIVSKMNEELYSVLCDKWNY